MDKVELIQCTTAKDFETAKQITADYITWLGIDLSFQNIEKEYDNFEEMYAPPDGCYLYLKAQDNIAGGVAFRFLYPGICEMKRLFVYPRFQQNGYGMLLCKAIIQQAIQQGYTTMRLDTIAKLHQAIKMYKNLGFYKINQYRENPDSSATFMELNLLSATFL